MDMRVIPALVVNKSTLQSERKILRASRMNWRSCAIRGWSARPKLMTRRAAWIKIIALAVVLGIVTREIRAWGPHSRIVDAALSVLPAEDGLGKRLGADAGRLRLYVLMGDWRNTFLEVRESWDVAPKQWPLVGQQIYTNDYLIFPQAPRHYEHEMPDVAYTWEPFFLRTLQALRTETPSNAARWMGALLHFVTDSGAPPHALGILGEDHVRMENWLDASKIEIPGYRPQLFGHTDAEAVQGYLARMRGLVEFSKKRAERARPFATAGDRAATEPIVLESAIETAKVTADMIHTLMVLSAQPGDAAHGDLYAQIEAPSIPGIEALPAKLILLGTSFSTTSEPLEMRPTFYHGTIELHHLPPDVYQPVVYRVGCRAFFAKPITLKAGAAVRETWKLEADSAPGNLVRNPDFKIRWTSQDRPEHWQYEERGENWQSDYIKVDAGKRYRFSLQAAPPPHTSVSLQWLRGQWPQELGEPIDITQVENHLVAPATAAYARVVVHASKLPAADVRSIALVEESRTTAGK